MSTATLRGPKAAAREHRAVVKAGVFTLGTLALGAVVIVVLGTEHRMFDRNVTFNVYLPDVDGLKVDSPVRLGGLDVGRVSKISFSPDMKDTRVKVELLVSERFAARVRSDSIARVASRGMLGDKTVD